ncbi:MAG TPA: ferrous iron transport protein A [Candidatus Agathobaculum pullicola]|nr:ferrous iron transport protein A [Candidatus Agathobaculum pullicola]
MDHERFSPLSDLPEGSGARVHALHLSGGMRRRLQDLGLVAGTRVACIQRAAAGDPTAYRIRGAIIALRADDAAQIEIGVDT